MIFLPFVALLAAAQAAPHPVGGLDPRLARPGELDSVLDEYDRLCLAAPFARAAHEAAVRRSAWHFRPASNPPDGALANESARAYAFFRDTGRLPQCNLDTATGRPAPRAQIIARIEALLLRRLGTAPPRTEAAGAIFWQWPDEQPDRIVRLYLMRRPGDDPRQLSLTLQKWPAAAARGATTVQEPPR